MLWSYFDESGTDGQLGHTTISGFVATSDEWWSLRNEWQVALEKAGIQTFHYYECKNQRGEYQGWDWHSQCVPHLAKLAKVIASHAVIPMSASYSGDYRSLIVRFPEMKDRFPTAYSVLFELLVDMLIHNVEMRWTESSVAVVFAKQTEFAGRAKRIYDFHRYNGLWGPIVSFGYASPATVVPLQAADMLAFEVRRFLWGANKQEVYPLLRNLIEEGRIDDDEPNAYRFGDDRLAAFLASPPGAPMRTPPGY